MRAFTVASGYKGGMRVRIEGLEEAQKLFNPVATSAQIKLTSHESAKAAKSALIAVTPKKSGETAKGWRVSVDSPDRTTLINAEPAAAYLYYGAKAHEIPGTPWLSNLNNPRAQYYAPFGPVRGMVQHPGFKPNEKYARAIERDVGEMAFEISADMIIGFYNNHGTLQRRAKSGQFSKGF